MSIASAIQNAQQKVTNAYTAVNNKGGTLPATQNLSNLPTAISSIPTATEPTLASLTITPSATAQTLTPPSGTDGYNTVSVSAVTSAIDSDIQAGNIKSGVNILGVTGTVTALAGETRTVSITSTSGNTFTPSSGKNGITSIKCNPTNKALTITPTTTTQTFTVPTNYSGYGTVTCGAGTQPSGTYTITANGTYDVTNYASASVNVSGGGSFVGINREVVNGVYKAPTTSFTWSLPSTATDIGSNAMYYAFYGCTGLTGSLNLSSLTTLSGSSAMYYAFYGCTGLTGSLDLSSLTTISGDNAMQYAFQRCDFTSVDLSSLANISSSSALAFAFSYNANLTSVDLSSLTTLSGSNAMYYTFQYCTRLTSVDLSSLANISSSSALAFAFSYNANLTSVDLSSLTTLSGSGGMSYTFQNCTKLNNINFNNLQIIGTNSSSTNYRHFYQCFNGCQSLTSITFPNLEKVYCTGSSSAYGTFTGNLYIRRLYFPKLDTITYGTGASTSNQIACKNVFYGCSSLTELHFAAANQSAIEASPGYSTAWGRGAGNVTIYFDL